MPTLYRSEAPVTEVYPGDQDEVIPHAWSVEVKTITVTVTTVPVGEEEAEPGAGVGVKMSAKLIAATTEIAPRATQVRS